MRDWLRALPREDRKIIGEGLEQLEFAWPIGMPLCRALGKGLFELRVSLPSRRIARVMVCVYEDELVALHAFIKKTRAIPEADVKLARKRKQGYERTT